MTVTSIKHIALTIIGIITISAASAQNKIAATLDSLMQRTNKNGLFNGNLMVVEHGKIIYKKAIGYADTTKQIPLTTDYRFHIGSIAKEFNAVAIMMLKDQGKLSLDDKVSKFFPELPAWANSISVKNLLQYTSGLPEIKWKTVNGDADNWADLQKIEKLNFEPGTSYNYNNNNTFLQRRIVEKLSGMSFNDFVYQKMLKPLRMVTAVVDPGDKVPLMAKGFNNSLKQDLLAVPISGWTCLTLDDFYKWELALQNFKLISREATQEILTPFAEGKQCGLGGGIMQGNKLVYHQHDGITRNYQALLTSHLKQGQVIILMSNNRQNNVFDIKDALEAILDGKPYQELKK